MPLIGNYSSNATVKVVWLVALLVFTAPEGTPVGIMTEQLETVTRATQDSPPGSHTVLRFTSWSMRASPRNRHLSKSTPLADRFWSADLAR